MVPRSTSRDGNTIQAPCRSLNKTFEVWKRILVTVYIIGLPGAKKTQVVTTARLKPHLVRDESLQPSPTEDIPNFYTEDLPAATINVTG